jgi:hypothetical protein
MVPTGRLLGTKGPGRPPPTVRTVSTTNRPGGDQARANGAAMSNVLVGFDGSTVSRAALRWAHRVAQPRAQGLQSVLLGSVAGYVATHATRPLGVGSAPPPAKEL